MFLMYQRPPLLFQLPRACASLRRMASIQVLSSELIDRIAAGEVVERPASVVKELVENSLDAGAGRVTIDVEEGGRSLIEVADDGRGMSRTDLELAVARHATSKIKIVADLERIATLGFRGEALSSIAAVSRLRITTRRKEDAAGVSLAVEGGRRVELAELGAPVGTQVAVSDLFFNTPARRKFLRALSTELGHIQAWVTRLALARADVQFVLQHGRRRLIDAPAAADLTQRAAAVLGREVFEHLHPLDYSQDDLTIAGLVSAPDLSRANPKGIYFFINGRFVRDRLLQHALMAGYQTVLPHGRFPVAVLKIELDPTAIDVNVHPQKTEVRFGDTRVVHHAVSAAVASVMACAPWLKNARSYIIRGSDGADKGVGNPRAGQVREALSRYAATGQTHWSTTRKSPPVGLPFDLTAPAQEVPLSSYNLVGTLWDTYLLLSSPAGLFAVDQHAAAERITFERLRLQADSARVASQRLLVPVQLELDAGAVARSQEQRGRILALGFEVEKFGETTLNITAVPALLASASPAALLADVLDELATSDSSLAWESARLEVLGRMACHSSLRAGRSVSETEIRALLEQLERIDFAGTCPHGRPVMARFSKTEVERWFQRT